MSAEKCCTTVFMQFKTISKLFIVGLLLIQFNAASQVLLNLNTAAAKTTINRNIYGHFSEHLGRCIITQR